MFSSRASRSIASIVVLLLIAAPVFAQEDSPLTPHAMSDMPSWGRYQIVQSHNSYVLTFRLDRHTGDVDQFAYINDGSGVAEWRSLDSAPGLQVVSDGSEPRFVLFTSGPFPIDMFLIDTTSGQTWALRADGTIDGWYWDRVLEE